MRVQKVHSRNPQGHVGPGEGPFRRRRGPARVQSDTVGAAPQLDPYGNRDIRRGSLPHHGEAATSPGLSLTSGATVTTPSSAMSATESLGYVTLSTVTENPLVPWLLAETDA